MRHGCRVAKLNRPTDQRKAMLRALVTNLVRNGQILTTKARAKAIRSEVEHMITLAKATSMTSSWFTPCLPRCPSAMPRATAATPAFCGRCPVAVTMPKWRLSSFSRECFFRERFVIL
jgi:Ribosomal protein L17